MSTPKPRKTAVHAIPSDAQNSGVRVGRIVGLAGSGFRVDFPGNSRGPIAARSTLPLDAATRKASAQDQREVVLLFEDGDSRRPIVIGLVQSDTPNLDAVLAAAPAVEKTVARVDGKRVIIEGRDEIELRCGAASLVMTRDGRILLRGGHVVTESKGVHRIRGGKVEIN